MDYYGQVDTGTGETNVEKTLIRIGLKFVSENQCLPITVYLIFYL